MNCVISNFGWLFEIFACVRFPFAFSHLHYCRLFAFFPYLSYIGKAFVFLRKYVWPSVSSRERLEDRGRLCHHFPLDCDFALGLF